MSEYSESPKNYSDESSLIIRADTGNIPVITAIAKEIEIADSSVKVSSRTISDSRIISALKNVQDKNIAVSCVIDSKHMSDPSVIELIQSGINVHGRSYDEIMSSNFIILDNNRLFLGVYDLDDTKTPFGFAFLVRDKDLLKRFKCEYAILQKGSDSILKDYDFDNTLGPFDEMLRKNSLYDSSWYKEINLSIGTANGIWPGVVTTLPVITYMMPYGLTEFQYGGWSDDNNNGTVDFFDTDGFYDESSVSRTYNDFISGEEKTIYCRDARNVLIPYIEKATKSITVCAFNFTDPLVISELEKAQKKGIAVSTYLDYSFCRQNVAQYPAFKKMKSISNEFMLVRPLEGGIPRGGMLIIDDIVIISSSGFSQNAFSANDGYLYIINDADLYIGNMLTEFSKMRIVAYGWPENDKFTGNCILYDYIDKY